MRRSACSVVIALMLLAVSGAGAVPVPWLNGDFELGDLTWTYASTVG